jgi:hypothetical protein
MKKRYKFVAKGWDWKLFLDSFSQELRNAGLDIDWEAEYTGGVGMLTVDYGGDIDVVIDHKLVSGHMFRW